MPRLDRELTFWQRLAQQKDLNAQPLPGLPIVELAGERRVLIEEHQGVEAYSPLEIGIRVPFGRILVRGTGMELTRMTREQLVIHGNIESVSLERRE